MANGGTLFLDEVGDMSLPAQAKLLRVLQERRLRRVGGKKDIDVDVRVIAATNKDLINEIRKENFREDLYYRLNVVHVQMPSLHEIKEDIPVLAKHFLDNFTSELGRGPTRFSQKTMNYMVNYNWPGNVRELENEIKRAVILSESDEINENNLSENLRNRLQAIDYSIGTSVNKEHKFLKDTVQEIEIKMINDALDKTGGNKQKASEILGLSRQGLIKKIKRYGL